MKFTSATSAFLALATHSSIQTHGFSVLVGNGNRVQNKAIARRNPCGIHNRVSTSRLFAEEEGNTVEELAVEEKSSIKAAAEEEQDKTEEVKEAEKDKPPVLCDVPPASHSMVITSDGPSGGKLTTMIVHLGMSGHPALVCQS